MLRRDEARHESGARAYCLLCGLDSTSWDIGNAGSVSSRELVSLARAPGSHTKMCSPELRDVTRADHGAAARLIDAVQSPVHIPLRRDPLQPVHPPFRPINRGVHQRPDYPMVQPLIATFAIVERRPSSPASVASRVSPVPTSARRPRMVSSALGPGARSHPL